MTPQQNLIRRLLAVFGAPQTEDVEMYLNEFEKVVSRFSPHVLEQAGDMAMRECKFFPRPAEIVEFCRVAAPMQTGTPENFRDYEIEPPSEEAKERVRGMIAKCLRHLSDPTIHNQPVRRSLSRKDLASGERE